jgi:hypothetical protein
VNLSKKYIQEICRVQFMKIVILVLALTTAAILFGFGYSLTDVVASEQVVSVGRNGSLWDSFIPQNIEIKVGESVTWRATMPVPEPHTVTFIMDDEYFAPFVAPF